MRILLSVPWFFPQGGGGGQTYVLHVAKELQRRGYDVCVLTGQAWGADRKTARQEDGPQSPVSRSFALSRTTYDGLPVLALQIHPAAVRWEEAIAESSPVLRAGLRAALDEAKPDLVHLNGFKPTLTRLCSETGIPFVVTAHHPGVVCPAGLRLNEKSEICVEVARPEVCVRCCTIQRAGNRAVGAALAALPSSLSHFAARASGLGGPLGKVVRAAAYPGAVRESLKSKALVWEKAPLWVAPSQAMRTSLLRQGIPAERVAHIPHGIEPVMCVPAVTAGQGFVRFGYLGGFSRIKGLHVLLEAASHLEHPERCEIHVFGMASTPWEEAYRDATVGRYTGRAKLVLHGPALYERIAEAYGAFDVLIVPSLCPEVFGLVVLESFTAGRPIIVSDAGGLPELVRDGVDGFVVPHGSAGDLAAKMEGLLEDPHRVVDLASAAPQTRTVQEHAEELVAVYRRAAATLKSGL